MDDMSVTGREVGAWYKSYKAVFENGEWHRREMNPSDKDLAAEMIGERKWGSYHEVTDAIKAATGQPEGEEASKSSKLERKSAPPENLWTITSSSDATAKWGTRSTRSNKRENVYFCFEAKSWPNFPHLEPSDRAPEAQRDAKRARHAPTAEAATQTEIANNTTPSQEQLTRLEHLEQVVLKIKGLLDQHHGTTSDPEDPE